MKIIPFGPDPFYQKKIIFSYDLFEKLQYTRNSHIRLNNGISNNFKTARTVAVYRISGMPAEEAKSL